MSRIYLRSAVWTFPMRPCAAGFLKFGSTIAANLRRTWPRPSDHWHLDEMVIVIERKRYWLWRAVDNEGEILDFLVQRLRDTKAARRLMKGYLRNRALHQTGWFLTSFGLTRQHFEP